MWMFGLKKKQMRLKSSVNDEHQEVITDTQDVLWTKVHDDMLKTKTMMQSWQTWRMTVKNQ
uniref:Uncharacterized protein n=1 Tax=Oryza punctata TaxID=4537 RepID=A0A0E0MF21_ORYPU